MEVNKFQTDLCNRILKLAYTKLVEVSLEEIVGDKETYLKLITKNICIYVYFDGADYQGRNIDERYEKEGFGGDLEILANQLIVDLSNYFDDSNKYT